MKILNRFYIFVLAIFLVACATPVMKAPSTLGPPVSTATTRPPATNTSIPIPSMTPGKASTPVVKDPTLSVIQFNCPASNAPSNCDISLVEPQTGKVVRSMGSFFNPMGPVAVNTSHLAALQGTGEVCEPMAMGTACYSEADVLHLVDLKTSHDVTATLPAQGWVDQAAFSPDGTRLALAVNHKQGTDLLYVDTNNGSILASQVLAIRPSLIAFDKGENTLVVYGQAPSPNSGVQQPGNPHVLLLTLPDLKIAWDRELTGILSGFWCQTNCDGSIDQASFANWYPVVVIAPNGSALYIAHADQDKLTKVDFKARTVTVTSLQTASSWLERLLSFSAQVAYAKGNQNGTAMQGVLSPDGNRLYLLAQTFHSTRDAKGNWNTDISYSGLKVIDVKTGRILKILETHASELQLSVDGNYLYTMNWDSPQAETEVVDTEKLQIVKRLPGWRITLTRQLDGSPIAMAYQVEYTTYEEIGILDPQEFSIGQTWKSADYIQFVPIQEQASNLIR